MPGVCHRCKRNVYVADEKVALGRVWHNFCVSCRKCRKLLDECSAKLYQDEIYCRKCYGAICGRSEDEEEERRCGGRRGGCCRRCPTPARIPARAKPSPTAVTAWYSRGHSTQPCKACPRCSAKEPWYVCEGGSQRCPDGIGCERRSRARTRTSCCDESCPARKSLESVPSTAEDKCCTTPKVRKKTSPPPCVCCNCCSSERRKSCCRRCLRLEKADKERENSCRSRHSCDRSTCCAWRARQRSKSPCSTADPPCVPCDPPCIPCPTSDEGRKSRPRRRRSCDRSTCCAWRARQRSKSPCSTADPPCVPCDPPCIPCPTSDEGRKSRSRRRRSCDRSTCCAWRARERSKSPCSTADPPCVPCASSDEERKSSPRGRRSCDRSTCCAWRARRRNTSPCPAADPPCVPCPPLRRKTPEPPCSPCPPCTPCPALQPKAPDPPCAPKTPLPPCEADGVEVLCPAADRCWCSCSCGRRRGRSATSSDRASKASSFVPCPAAKPRCCRTDLPIGKPCRRCGRQVYHAELVLAAGTVFHTCCFTCRQCRKPLESTTVYEAQNEIFCKQCYVKRFGPSGYGYGLGAGALQTP